MEQENNTKQRIDESVDFSCEYIAGPLYINRLTKQAKTVLGANIVLNNHDFEALDLLVSKEGEYLSLQKLYEASWSKSVSTDSIDYAFTAIDNIITQINNAGEDFMWIETKTGVGYMFKTRWGQDWKNNYTVVDSPGLSITDVNSNNINKKIIKRKISKKSLLAGAGTLVAAIILTFVVLYTTGVIALTTTEPLYIDDTDIVDPGTPLANLEFDD